MHNPTDDESHPDGTEVRVSKVGDEVLVEPMDKKPFDAAAWRARLEEHQHIPFMDGGREQGTIADDGDDKKPIDLDAWFARLDELGARDFLPDGIPDDPPLEPDPRVFFDE